MLAAVVLFAMSGTSLAPARLECEAATDPLGIDVAQPRLSWIDQANEPGVQQSAYRIRVASSPRGLAKPDLWDTGRVASDASTEIAYQGKPLASAQRVYWDVQVWDSHGSASAPSRPATWTMHLLQPSDWTGQWVGAGPRTKENPHVTLNFRKMFGLSARPSRVLAFVCGLGQYELSINGKRVGNDWLSPAWSQYQKSVIADVYDVTAQFGVGYNTVGVLLGNGMYDMSTDTRGSQQRNTVGDLKLLCQLRFEFPDGSVKTVATDSSWRWHPSPATYSGVFGGEDWDARNEQPGWNTNDFNDTTWHDAVTMAAPSGQIRGFTHTGPPLRTIEVREPVKISEPKKDVVVLDLGQNAPYIPELTTRGAAGSVVTLSPAEQLDEHGFIDQRTMRAGKHVTYTLRGGGPEVWQPAFWYCGSRYWQAEAHTPDGKAVDPRSILKRFRGLMVHSSSRAVSEFECSNNLINRIHEMIRWSIRSNLSHVISDCPHREKSGWLEQDHLMGPGLLYTYDMRRLFAKTVADMVDAQHADGRVPTMAPEYFFYDAGFADSVEWGGSIGLVPKLMSAWYGDSTVVANSRPALVSYFKYLQTRAKDGILSNGLGDWNGGGNDPRTPIALTDTAYFFALCELLKASDPATYGPESDRIKAAFNRAFLDRATGKYATGSQSCQATALDLGLVPDDVAPKAFERLLDDLASTKYAISCGEVGHPAILHVLAAHGRSDLIAKIHLQTDKPGYAFQLAKGLTTLAESWDAQPISLNHFMLGQLLEWMYAELAGIKPDPAHPGFQYAVIAPHPVADVGWTKASYDSCHGLYKVSWLQAQGEFTVDVTIPANCHATVALPATGSILLDGKPYAGSNQKLSLGSGDHHVVVIERA